MKFKNILLIVVSFFLLTSCKKNSPQGLTVGIMPDLDSIPIIVAKQQGFLPDYVTLEIFRSPVDRDSALLSGNLDGTISDVLAVALAQNGGFDAYATSETNGRYAVLVGKGSGITSAEQLEGKQIGLSLNTIIEYVADRVIIESGGEPGKTEKVAVPKIPARLELLESNQIDAIAVPEPYVTAAAASGAKILNTSGDLNINPAVMLFTGGAISNKQMELAAFYGAYDKAVEYIDKTDPEEFMPQVIADLGLPESAIDVVLPAYEKKTPPDKSEVDKAVEWLFEKELIGTKFQYNDLVKGTK